MDNRPSRFDYSNDNDYRKAVDEYTKKQEKIISKVIMGFVAFVIIIFIYFTSTFTVGAGQIGIVTKFGKVNRVAESGFGFKIPFVEKVVKMDTRVQKEEVKSSAATKDLQDVNTNLVVNYSINSNTALEIYNELGQDYKDNIIIPAVNESFKASASRYTAEELVSKRSEVKDKAYESIKNRLDKYGITIVDLNITELTFSTAFNEAIEQKQVAQQNAEKAKQDLERVRVENTQRIERAEADAKAQELQKSTLDDSILKKMELETQQKAISKWNGQLPTTTAGSGTIFNIPVGK